MGFNKESRTVNAGKNTVSALANKIILLLLTFVSRKLFIEYIGVEYLGINGLFSNILTLLSMADLGLGTAMNVSLYKPIVQEDTRKITALLNYFKKLYTYIAIAVVVLGLGLLPFLKYLVNLDSDIPYLYVYYIVFVLKNAASYIFVYKTALIRADQKTYMINKVEVYVMATKDILKIFLIMLFKNYLLYILMDVAAVVMQNFIASKYADRQYAFINEKYQLEKSEKKTIFTDISSVFLYKIAWGLLNGTDNILMSVIVGTIYVGLYSNYYTITSTLDTFIALMFTSLTAGIGNLVATATYEKKYNTFQTMQMVSFWICGFVTVCLYFLMQDFITLWLGETYLLDRLTLIAIVANVFFSICMRPVWTFREGTGMYRQIRYVMFITALENLVLSIVLGKWLGVGGILIATSISKITTYFWYEPYILFKTFFNTKPYKYYLEYLKNFIVMAFCVLICHFAVSFIEGISVVKWLLKAVICGAIINIVYLARYYKTKEFGIFKDRLRMLLKR